MEKETRNSDRPPRSLGIRSVPHLVRREILAAFIALAVLGLVSALFNAPLQGPADPSGIPAEDVKAPWIFVGIQQALRYLPALIAGILLPLVAVAALAVTPFLPRETPFQRKALWTLVFGTVLVSLSLTVWGYLF